MVICMSNDIYHNLIKVVDRKVYEMTKTIVGHIQNQLHELYETRRITTNRIKRLWLNIRIKYKELEKKYYLKEYVNMVTNDVLPKPEDSDKSVNLKTIIDTEFRTKGCFSHNVPLNDE